MKSIKINSISIHLRWIDDEIRNWCFNNCGSVRFNWDDTLDHRYTVEFKFEEDATAFKLKFGL